jgi:hypothetical protein
MSDVIGVSSFGAPSSDEVRAYSSFIAKYALENRKFFGARRNGLTTVAVIVSSAIRDETKRWVSETPPEYSVMWARAEFPVLVDLSDRQVTYYTKSPLKFGIGRLYQSLRSLSDKWFGSQA